MQLAVSVATLFDAAFGGWPWRLVPWTTGGLVLLVGTFRIALLLVRIHPARRKSARIDASQASVQEVLERLRAELLQLGHSRSPDAVGIVEQLILAAAVLGASDIHLAPLSRGLTITIRVHGNLHTVDTLPSEASSLVCNRLKVMARLDLHVRSTPQDGRLVLEVAGRTVEARISTLPTEGGERIVLRLVEGARSVPGLGSLGFTEEIVSGLSRLLSRPQGLLFVTGPVGSGKSSTLYATLAHISQTRGDTTSIVTLEDPIELRLPFAAQTQINTRAKMTFASGLRSALRQDPNVLMVGEIRDRETADIAMQASLTGHLLLTTVHADDATGPFARMIDMGIEPFLLANSVIGSLSQRLVRRLCPRCRRPFVPEDSMVERFRSFEIELGTHEYFEPGGCSACERQGFLGRIPIAELLQVDHHVRSEIHDGCSAEVIRRHAIERGMTPLMLAGTRLAQAGDTTLAEVLRVAG